MSSQLYKQHPEYLMKLRQKPKHSIKRFTVSCKKYNVRNPKEALTVFKKWHDRYYPNDKIEIVRIHSERAYIIQYRVLNSEE